MQLIIVTGISGSGKSLAINVLEDAGFFCIDNLPVQYLLDVAMSLEREGQGKVAVSVGRDNDAIVLCCKVMLNAPRARICNP